MMTFVNTRSEGLTILPTHRVVANLPDFSWISVRRYLEPWFAAEAFPFTNEGEKAGARAKFLAPPSGSSRAARHRRLPGGRFAASAPFTS